tara:strand:+ start:2809 stop:3387 length:579 start_codon:yes stop_codon:yes gene_type:complete
MTHHQPTSHEAQCPAGIYADQNACCVLILASNNGERGTSTSWCIRAAYDESSPDFGLTYERWADRVDAEHIRMHVDGVVFHGKISEQSIVWTDPSVAKPVALDGSDDQELTTMDTFTWRRFHIAPHQFAIIRRPPAFFMSSIILRALLYLLSLVRTLFVWIVASVRRCCLSEDDSTEEASGDEKPVTKGKAS